MSQSASTSPSTAPKTPDFDRELASFTSRQMEAIRHLDSGKIKFLLYGGALGGGKSYFLRWYGVRRLMVLFMHFGIKQAVGMLACEDYPSLKDRQLSKISREFPAWMGKMHQDHRDYGRCFILHEKWGGGVLCFRNLDDPSKYASAEFAFILVDELTKNPYDVFTFLRTRLRWKGLTDVECQLIGATNPGSVGHGWVKQLWMDKLFGDEWIYPFDYRSQFAYVPSLADDNPHLDASYWAMLETLPENLRKAFRHGDWNIFVGQAFPEFSRETHVIKPIPVPDNAPLYMTYDWGFGKPFSIGWWWVDADGRIYRFAEWYGWNGSADTGMRIPDSDVAIGVKEREEALGITGKKIIRLCDPTCFNKKPDYKGGGQGPSTAEEFSKFGIFLSPGDADRKLKIRQFRERLKPRKEDGGRPMMYVYDTCTQFIRTIPNLIMDENNVEDVDTKGEDHQFDEACHICMARPISMTLSGIRPSMYDRRLDELEKTHRDTWEDALIAEERAIQKELGLDPLPAEMPVEDRGCMEPISTTW